MLTVIILVLTLLYILLIIEDSKKNIGAYYLFISTIVYSYRQEKSLMELIFEHCSNLKYLRMDAERVVNDNYNKSVGLKDSLNHLYLSHCTLPKDFLSNLSHNLAKLDILRLEFFKHNFNISCGYNERLMTDLDAIIYVHMPYTRLGSLYLENNYRHDCVTRFNSRVLYKLLSTESTGPTAEYNSIGLKGKFRQQHKTLITKEEYSLKCQLPTVGKSKPVIYSVECMSVNKLVFKEGRGSSALINYPV